VSKGYDKVFWRQNRLRGDPALELRYSARMARRVTWNLTITAVYS